MKNIVLFATLLSISNSKAYSAFRTLEADYITNVFSQSNFVKNPNARVNTINVTAPVGVTLTRSTTSPLFEVSEFNITATSAAANIDWALRPFDQGMKGGNCEAKFAYRGFGSGTTAEIVQGGNTVATVILSYSSDPRPVSINFPCGNLSTTTIFRIKKPASFVLSGLNEIGGIYVGLATNTANISQAEEVLNAGTNAGDPVTISANQTLAPWKSAQYDPQGAYNLASGEYTASKQGRYSIAANIAFDSGSWTASNQAFRLSFTINNTMVKFYDYKIPTTGTYAPTATYTTSLELNPGDKLKVTVTNFSGATRVVSLGDLSIHRYPLQSELALRPNVAEKVWAGLTVSDLNPDGDPIVIDSSYVDALAATYDDSPYFYGKAVDTGNYDLRIPNLTLGTYRIQVSANMRGTNATTLCSWRIVSSLGQASGYPYFDETGVNSLSQVTWIYDTQAQVSDVTFKLQARRVSGTGACYIPRGSPFSFTIDPLSDRDTRDFVVMQAQVPILASGTGAAIPAGYIGEEAVSEISTATSSGLANGATVSALNTITLQPGVWLVSATQTVFQNGSTGTLFCSKISDVSAASSVVTGVGSAVTEACGWPTNNVAGLTLTHAPFIYKTTASRVLFLNSQANYTAGVPTRRGSIRAVRIN